MALLKNKLMVILLVAVGFFSIIAVSLLGWDIRREGPLAEETSIEIPRGSGVSTITYILKKEGVIRHPLTFRVLAKLSGKESKLHAGKYLVSPKVSVENMLKQMFEGETQKFKITFPEGLRTHEILSKIKATDSLKWDIENVDVYTEQVPLLPETYVHEYGMKASALLEKMKRFAEKEMNDAWDARDEGLPIESKQELLTLASIVEKETSVDSERKEVAGVFVHRLHKGMRLQSDPTVIYGIKNYDGDIRRKDLNNPHPYNTYRHNGLPPGPIAHPGKASIWAVAQPNITENLYFVADGTGGHVFAKNLTQHNKNVRAYLDYYRKHIKNKSKP